jgi:hypothetical protein
MAEPGDPKVGLFARIQSLAVGHPRGAIVKAEERVPVCELINKYIFMHLHLS